MASDHPQFNFENWDFMDPRIVSKFKTISEVSQMLSEQQDKLKNAEFVSFKDKKMVQGNINRFKSSLQNLIHSQKENLINYFDKQLDYVSKKVNVPLLSRTFQKSFHLQNSSKMSTFDKKPLKMARRYSEGDLAAYIKEAKMKEDVLSELKSHAYENESNRESMSFGVTTRSDFKDNMESSNNAQGSWLNINDLEQRDSTKAREDKLRKDSIFSRWGQETDNQTHEDSHYMEKQLRELREEIKRKDESIAIMKEYCQVQRRKALEKKASRRQKVIGKEFVRDGKVRRRYGRVIKRKEIEEDSEKENLRNENEMLKESLGNSEKRNGAVVNGMKELSKIVLANEQLLEEMVNNKREIEGELKRSKELNSKLVTNFTQFKGYVQKTLGDVSSKLGAYVKKEELYSDIVKENEELKQKCKSLLRMLKEATHD